MKNKKLITGLVLSAFVLGVAVIAGFVMGDTTTYVNYSKQMKVESADLTPYITEEDVELAPFYKWDMSAYFGDDTGSLYYVFNTDNNTFSMLYGSQEVGTGTFKIEGNEVILISEGATEDSANRYLLVDDMLLLEPNICSGDIPEGDTFDLTCYQKADETSVYYYQFSSDGSYKLINYQKTADDKDDKMLTGEGTYTRDGKYITTTITYEKGEQVSPPYLIYDNHLVTSYYVPISAEQYEQEYAANEAALQAAQSSDSTETE